MVNNLRTNLDRNIKNLDILKLKKQNIENEILNLENKIRNQEQALKRTATDKQ